MVEMKILSFFLCLNRSRRVTGAASQGNLKKVGGSSKRARSPAADDDDEAAQKQPRAQTKTQPPKAPLPSSRDLQGNAPGSASEAQQKATATESKPAGRAMRSDDGDELRDAPVPVLSAASSTSASVVLSSLQRLESEPSSSPPKAAPPRCPQQLRTIRWHSDAPRGDPKAWGKGGEALAFPLLCADDLLQVRTC